MDENISVTVLGLCMIGLLVASLLMTYVTAGEPDPSTLIMAVIGIGVVGAFVLKWWHL